MSPRPGTRVRAEGFGGAGFLEAAVKSFVLAALEWVRWLDVPLLCLLLLLALPLCRLARSAGRRTVCSAVPGWDWGGHSF